MAYSESLPSILSLVRCENANTRRMTTKCHRSRVGCRHGLLRKLQLHLFTSPISDILGRGEGVGIPLQIFPLPAAGRGSVVFVRQNACPARRKDDNWSMLNLIVKFRPPAFARVCQSHDWPAMRNVSTNYQGEPAVMKECHTCGESRVYRDTRDAKNPSQLTLAFA